MINKIVFFHEHVNGDCYSSRMIVNQIILSTKSLGIEYYYTAKRALNSHCLDIGIPDANFNTIDVNNYSLHYVNNNTLFINVWIGNNINNLSVDMFCCFCLKTLYKKYNSLINILNQSYNYLNISPIDERYMNKMFLPFNFNAYNEIPIFIDFIKINRDKYKKIVLICNVNPTTFITTVNITQKYLSYIANKYTEYLFITFNHEVELSNVISISQIYNQYTEVSTTRNSIIFSYLSTHCDKIILLPTGPSLCCYNNNIHDENKYMMFFDYSSRGNPGRCPYCSDDIYKTKLCTIKMDWYINICQINNKDDNYIRNYVEEFINY